MTRSSLDGAEGRHAVSVARVRVGEVLRIADGRGTVVSGPVTALGKDTLELAVETVEHQDAPRPSLTLVQALAKGGRDEMAVQAATEIGVDRVVPWSAARSVSRWDGAKVEKGRTRWAAIAHEAAKQAIRPRVPVVAPLVTTGQLVSALGDGTTLVLLDPTATVRLATWGAPDDAEDIALVVGPEGGIDGRGARPARSRGCRAGPARRQRAAHVHRRTGGTRCPAGATRPLVSRAPRRRARPTMEP